MAKKEFEESATETLAETCAKGLKIYGFKNLYESVLNVIDLQTLPASKRTAKLDRLISLYESERRRVGRIAEWIRRKNAAQ